MFKPKNLPSISSSKKPSSCRILEIKILTIQNPIGSKSSLIVWNIRLEGFPLFVAC